MTQSPDRAEEILNAAEKLARAGGYNGFSFRDIAKAVNIKSASVHYHFETKEALGAALARRYTENFLTALGDPASFKSSEAAIARYIAAYRSALIDDGLMCLCGVLGAEIEILPQPVAREAKTFFERNVEWLENALSREKRSRAQSRKSALSIIALLEGAMIVARSLEDHNTFDDVAGAAASMI